MTLCEMGPKELELDGIEIPEISVKMPVSSAKQRAILLRLQQPAGISGRCGVTITAWI